MYLFLAALLAFVIAQYDPDSQPMEFPPSPFLPKELIPRYETPLNQKELSFLLGLQAFEFITLQ